MASDAVVASLTTQTHSPDPTAMLEPVLTSALEQLKATAVNATSFFNPSSKDLLMVVPRMAARAGSFVTQTIPDTFESIFGAGNAGRFIAEATSEGAQGLAAVSAGLQGAADTAGGTAILEIEGPAIPFSHLFGFQQVRSFGGV